MPSFVKNGSAVLEIFEGFLTYMGMASCDLNHLYKLWFGLSKEAPLKSLALIDPAVSEKIFEMWTKTDTRALVFYKLTCEPPAQVS